MAEKTKVLHVEDVPESILERVHRIAFEERISKKQAVLRALDLYVRAFESPKTVTPATDRQLESTEDGKDN